MSDEFPHIPPPTVRPTRLDILEYLTNHRHPISITELATAVGMTRATTRRKLNGLVASEAVVTQLVRSRMDGRVTILYSRAQTP